MVRGIPGPEISTPDDNKDKAWHVLKADVFEVSPVLRGAQPGTHTISQKADETAPMQASNQPETKVEADPLFAHITKHLSLIHISEPTRPY